VVLLNVVLKPTSAYWCVIKCSAFLQSHPVRITVANNQKLLDAQLFYVSRTITQQPSDSVGN